MPVGVSHVHVLTSAGPGNQFTSAILSIFCAEDGCICSFLAVALAPRPFLLSPGAKPVFV